MLLLSTKTILKKNSYYQYDSVIFFEDIKGPHKYWDPGPTKFKSGTGCPEEKTLEEHIAYLEN